jgi:hypothetical protein
MLDIQLVRKLSSAETNFTIAIVDAFSGTYVHLFFSKACVLKNNSKVDVTLSTGHFVLRAILIEIGHVFSIVFKIHALRRRAIINKLLVVF